MAPVPHPRFCACCTPAAPRAPATVWNRPGLSAVACRIGTFATFRQAMLEEIHGKPELSGLLTREADDHAITFLELFAAVGDVLTFYAERLANELYLHQARHLSSVEDLVALLGYRPRPALSATGLLAFEIESGKASRLWAGLKVMSVPGPDERPQTFETMEEVAANGRLNAAAAYAPFRHENPLARGSREAPLLAAASLVAGDRFVLFGRDILEDKTVERVDAGADGTRLVFSPAVQQEGLSPRNTRAVPLRRRLRFFGHNAPATHTVYDPDPGTPPQNRWSVETIDAAFPDGAADYPLDTRVDDLAAGAHLLVDAGATAVPRYRTAVVTGTDERAASLGPLADTVTHVALRETVAGRPSVAVPPFGPAVTLARTGGNHPAFMGEAAPRDLDLLGPLLFAAEDVTGLTTDLARFDAFTVDAAGRLRQLVVSFGGGMSPWIDRGGAVNGLAAPVALSGGAVRVFARGADGALWTIDASDPAAAAPWERLGGLLGSPPVAVTPDGTRIAVFVRGLDRALWWRAFDGAAWAPWERLGGVLASPPAATASPVGLDVFARAPDGHLHHRRRDGTGWQPWRDLGGTVEGAPAAVGGAPDWAAAVTRGPDGKVALIGRIGPAFTPWIDQGGEAASDPSVGADATGLKMAVRAGDGTIATATATAGPTPPAWSRGREGLAAIPDRRAARLFEIGADEIAFRPFVYPERAAGPLLAIPLRHGENPADEASLGALTKGRRVIVAGGGRHHAAVVTARLPVAAEPGEPPDHLFVGIDPPLPETAGPLVLLGNVAKASHGETRTEEALGSGDAGRPFQSFPVPPGEISHLPSAKGTRPLPEVALSVGGIRWTEVPHLYGRGAKEKVFTLRTPTDADPVVTGGDGARAGARFPTGALNVRLTRRLGAGLAGNLAAGQLSIPLERPVGLRAAANPMPTSGGAPGESADDVRRAAPAAVGTFGRIVGLADFASLATASGLAARAHVTWVWNRLERTAHLTVAGPGGAPLTAENLALLHAQLTASRDPNRPLMIANLVRVPVVIDARLVLDPAHAREAVLAAAREALLSAFAFETTALGAAVHLSAVHAVLQGVAGVLAVNVTRLHLKDHMDLSADERAVRAVSAAPVQPHIRLYPSRPVPADPAAIDRYQRDAFAPGPPPAVLPAEQAFLEDAAGDVGLAATEAL